MNKPRILFLILICLFMLVSCSDYTVIENESGAPVGSSTESGGYEYIINTNSKKYHMQSCSYVITMKEEYRKTTTDIDFIKERGYTPCGNCIARR